MEKDNETCYSMFSKVDNVHHNINTFLLLKMICSNQAFLSRGAEGASTPQKFSVDMLFFADESFKCALFERSNQKCKWKLTSKILSKIKKTCTLKRRSFLLVKTNITFLFLESFISETSTESLSRMQLWGPKHHTKGERCRCVDQWMET